MLKDITDVSELAKFLYSSSYSLIKFTPNSSDKGSNTSSALLVLYLNKSITLLSLSNSKGKYESQRSIALHYLFV